MARMYSERFRRGRGNVSCLPDTKGKKGIVIACKWYACRLSFLSILECPEYESSPYR
ncbi:hypothetical protein HMPREF2534_04451 [Bacteroides thetaiotaomicron]|nr:hypothetical protein HMPREF2534_04451 [Bacteroides thetaiotaomicron]